MSLQNLTARASRHPTLLIATTAATLLIAIPAIRITLLSSKLSRRIIYHKTLLGDSARRLISDSPTFQNHGDGKSSPKVPSKVDGPPSIPQPFPTPPHPSSELLSHPETHNLFYDISLLTLPKSTLPPSLDFQNLLTTYLQHTMTMFSERTPQGWLLWMMERDKQRRRSFEREWIESLGFEEAGERVCGGYVVLETGAIAENGQSAEGAKVVFEMRRGNVEGRLVVSVRSVGGLERKESETGFSDDAQKTLKVAQGNESMVAVATETWMWVSKEAKEVMPMEMAVPRFMHRLGSWWLLVNGTEYLQRLGGR